MAAAARLNPADARVPCPLCGNLIHPIAGRCKYCKGDLNAGRPQRAAAAGALPALVAVPTQPASYAPAQPAPYAPAPEVAPPASYVPAASAPIRESQQVLPPRPTGRMQATKRPSVWRSWPLIVIALASIAIVAAVVVMVWPDKQDDPKRNALEPPPAPIRMDTERGRPLPPSAAPGGPQGAAPPAGGSDPWSGGGAPDPDDVDTIDPPPAPDPYAQGTPPDPPKDPFKDFDKLAQDVACSSAKQVRNLATAQCPAARTCFDKIENMACSPTAAADLQDAAKMQSLLLDCMQTVNC